MSELKTTKENISITCSDCGNSIIVKRYKKEYVKTLEKHIRICHETLSQLIDKNKVSPAMYIILSGDWKETIGNIKADLPIKMEREK